MSGVDTRGSCAGSSLGRGSGSEAGGLEAGICGEGGRGIDISLGWLVVGCRVMRGEKRGGVRVTFFFFVFSSIIDCIMAWHITSLLGERLSGSFAYVVQYHSSPVSQNLEAKRLIATASNSNLPTYFAVLILLTR